MCASVVSSSTGAAAIAGNVQERPARRARARHAARTLIRALRVRTARHGSDDTEIRQRAAIEQCRAVASANPRTRRAGTARATAARPPPWPQLPLLTERPPGGRHPRPAAEDGHPRHEAPPVEMAGVGDRRQRQTVERGKAGARGHLRDERLGHAYVHARLGAGGIAGEPRSVGSATQCGGVLEVTGFRCRRSRATRTMLRNAELVAASRPVTT